MFLYTYNVSFFWGAKHSDILIVCLCVCVCLGRKQTNKNKKYNNNSTNPFELGFLSFQLLLYYFATFHCSSVIVFCSCGCCFDVLVVVIDGTASVDSFFSSGAIYIYILYHNFCCYYYYYNYYFYFVNTFSIFFISSLWPSIYAQQKVCWAICVMSRTLSAF